MTVDKIETVRELVNEMQADGTEVSSVWEFRNRQNNKQMFAVFPARQFCDIHSSSFVENPIKIWENGKFIGKYAWDYYVCGVDTCVAKCVIEAIEAKPKYCPMCGEEVEWVIINKNYY